jgi:pyridoxamine 5'-phosphate oxidase
MPSSTGDAGKLKGMVPEQSLPETLPSEPLTTVATWLEDAQLRRDQPNPDAMVLATVNSAGRPAARVVLCKGIDTDAGTVRFVSNYRSRKGQELNANPRAALVFHWDHLHRQVRIEGSVCTATAADSDSYFASRSRLSQLGAHASAQSEAIASASALQAQLDAVRARYPDAVPIPRPQHWGGYVMYVDYVELWVEAQARLHDRACWSREVADSCGAKPVAGPWTATRLQP